MAEKAREELIEGLQQLYRTKAYTDLVIDCGFEKHQAHRAVVCPRSKVIATACNTRRFDEEGRTVVRLHQEDPVIIKLMMHYFYHLDYPHVEPPPEEDANTNDSLYKTAILEMNKTTPLRTSDEEFRPTEPIFCAQDWRHPSESPPAPTSRPPTTGRRSSEESTGTEEQKASGAFPRIFRGTKKGRTVRKSALRRPSMPEIDFGHSKDHGDIPPPLRINTKAANHIRHSSMNATPLSTRKSDRILGIATPITPERPLPPPTPDEIELPAIPWRTQPASNLSIHTKVYAVADKYEISGLKALALEKFAEEAESHWGAADLACAANEAYTLTLGNDRGMRDAVVKLVHDHPEVADKEEVRGVIKGTALAFDLFMYSRNRRVH